MLMKSFIWSFESVGVGTTSGNGVGTVVTFRNPGVGASSVFIPTQAIYYRNHGLKSNERVDYFTNSGTLFKFGTVLQGCLCRS